ETATRSDKEPEKILFELDGNLKHSDPTSELAAAAAGSNGRDGRNANSAILPVSDELPRIPKTLGLRLESTPSQ
ncbi:hypothetical protein ABTA76_20180, partial [Acinetobacter baumannii]